MQDTFDLVFLDAEKDDYEVLFGLARPLLEPGGLVVADNVLSHAETLGAYSAARQADPTLSSVTVPLDRGVELSTGSSSDLGHEAVQVAVGVAEERHPELVVGHACDEMRLVLERHAALDELLLEPPRCRRRGSTASSSDGRTRPTRASRA